MLLLRPPLPPPTLECGCNIWSSRSHLGFRNVIAENKAELKSWNNILAPKFLHLDFLEMRESFFYLFEAFLLFPVGFNSP